MRGRTYEGSLSEVEKFLCLVTRVLGTFCNKIIVKTVLYYKTLLPVGKEIRLFTHFDWLIIGPYFAV